MKSNYLFPHSFKRIGWLLFIPACILGIMYLVNTEFAPAFLEGMAFAVVTEGLSNMAWFTWEETNYFDEIVGVLLIVGGGLVAFSKEVEEDEFIAQIRLESLLWATYVSYTILAFSIVFIYGLAFFWIMLLNMFTILIFFILRFHWIKYRITSTTQYEESY